MKVLFVHDHRFYEKDGVFYSPQFSPKTWEPYLQNGNYVTVYARKTSKKCAQVSSTDSHISYALSNSFSSPLSVIGNYNNIKEELESLIRVSDCVIIRLPSIAGVIASSIAYKYQKKLMAEVVGDAYDAYKYYGNLTGKIFAPIFKLLNQNAVRKMDAVLYVTKEYLQKLYPSTKLTCGCSDALLEPVTHEVLEKRLQRIDLRKGTFVCGEVGNISVPYKGYEVMLEAMSILKEKGIIIDFHIVGGGSPERFYKQAESYGVRSQVYYDGMMDHSKISEFYDSLDVYVHPSYTEGLPRVVAESISRGCPSLVSRAGGTPELVNENCIHDIKDAKKLALDLEALYNDKELYRNIAVENFNNAKSYYAENLLPIRLEFYNKFFRL